MMGQITEATIEERLVHYMRHIRSRIALSLKLKSNLPDGHIGIAIENARLANLEGILTDLTDILDGGVPRYTASEEL